MQYKDYYETLGVPRDADAETIKRAYRKLARKYHPDVSREPNCEARFKEVQEAYEVLKDSDKRGAYDRLGSGWRHGDAFRPEDAGFEFHGNPFEANASFRDIFEHIFGGGGRDEAFRMRGQDHLATLAITLEESYRGATRTVTLTVPDMDARGELRHVRRTVNVAIPKGVLAGQRIRLGGMGGKGFNRGPAGDAFIEVAFDPHPYFRAEGRDIHLELPVAPWEAALGAKVVAPTLGGRVELNIPPGSQNGRQLRLAGRGLPGSPAGDQYVVLRVVVPEARDEAQRELYREMARRMAFNPRAALDG